MANLYELGSEYVELLDRINAAAEENDGAVPDELFDELMTCDKDIDAKVENCAKAVRIIESEASVIDGEIAAMTAEIARLTKRKDAKLNAAERLKTRVATFMMSVDKEKVKTPLFTIYPKTTVSVNILDEEKLPIDLRRQTIKVEFKPDKKLIKERIESGETVSGAELIHTTRLQIK